MDRAHEEIPIRSGNIHLEGAVNANVEHLQLRGISFWDKRHMCAAPRQLRQHRSNSVCLKGIHVEDGLGHSIRLKPRPPNTLDPLQHEALIVPGIGLHVHDNAGWETLRRQIAAGHLLVNAGAALRLVDDEWRELLTVLSHCEQHSRSVAASSSFHAYSPLPATRQCDCRRHIEVNIRLVHVNNCTRWHPHHVANTMVKEVDEIFNYICAVSGILCNVCSAAMAQPGSMCEPSDPLMSFVEASIGKRVVNPVHTPQ